MIAAHIDQIGLMVTKIEEGGFIRFTTVGGWTRQMPAQAVTVHGREDLIGIIGMRPPHVVSAAERKKAVPVLDLHIDTGQAEDRVRELVRVGDVISLRCSYTKLQASDVPRAPWTTGHRSRP